MIVGSRKGPVSAGRPSLVTLLPPVSVKAPIDVASAKTSKNLSTLRTGLNHVDESSGDPGRTVWILASSSRITTSATAGCTMQNLGTMQICPEPRNVSSIESTASRISASFQTTSPSFPESSRIGFFPRFIHSRPISCPVELSPKNNKSLARGLSSHCARISRVGPEMRFKVPGGARCSSSTGATISRNRNMTPSGELRGALTTTALPASRAMMAKAEFEPPRSAGD